MRAKKIRCVKETNVVTETAYLRNIFSHLSRSAAANVVIAEILIGV